MKIHHKAPIFFLTCLFALATPAHAQFAVGTSLDLGKLKAALTNGWQRDLDTDHDPSNSDKWNTHDGGNGFGVGGLYGGLQETMVATQLGTPTPYGSVVAAIARGVFTNNSATAQRATGALDVTYSDVVSDVSAMSPYAKSGADIIFTILGTQFATAANGGGKFIADFTRTTANANRTSTVSTTKFSQPVDLMIPPNSTYAVVILAEQEAAVLPYQSVLALTGMSHTWFDTRVNGSYNWNRYVSYVIGKMSPIPTDWQLRDDGSVLVPIAKGILTAQRTHKFTMLVIDITNATPSWATTPLPPVPPPVPVHAGQMFEPQPSNWQMPWRAMLVSNTPIAR